MGGVGGIGTVDGENNAEKIGLRLSCSAKDLSSPLKDSG